MNSLNIEVKGTTNSVFLIYSFLMTNVLWGRSHIYNTHSMVVYFETILKICYIAEQLKLIFTKIETFI